MAENPRYGSSVPSDLTGIIQFVRARWRRKLAVRGTLRVIATAVAIFFALAYGMQWARFSAASIVGARVLLLGALAAEVLGVFGVVPDVGVFELAVYFDQAIMLLIVVKDTPEWSGCARRGP